MYKLLRSDPHENAIREFSGEQEEQEEPETNGRVLQPTFAKDRLRCFCNDNTFTIIIHLATLSIGMLLGAGIVHINWAGNCVHRGFWRASEFQPVTKSLPAAWADKLYDARLHYNESGILLRPSSDPDYVGTPTPELEQAWKRILPAVTIWITAEEEKTLYPEAGLVFYPQFGLYKGFLSVTHELHCVNLVRQYIYLEHYPELAADPRTPVHVDHCIDRLRLAIMCAGDMTVEPIMYEADGKSETPSPLINHTCRNFDAIRNWALERDAGHEERLYDNAARLGGGPS